MFRLLAITVCGFALTACPLLLSTTGKDEKSDNSLVLLALAAAAASNPPFTGSCAASPSICIDYFGWSTSWMNLDCSGATVFGSGYPSPLQGACAAGRVSTCLSNAGWTTNASAAPAGSKTIVYFYSPYTKTTGNILCASNYGTVAQ